MLVKGLKSNPELLARIIDRNALTKEIVTAMSSVTVCGYLLALSYSDVKQKGRVVLKTDVDEVRRSHRGSRYGHGDPYPMFVRVRLDRVRQAALPQGGEYGMKPFPPIGLGPIGPKVTETSLAS